jgi:3-hydroxybutyryl-CoA dehydratase
MAEWQVGDSAQFTKTIGDEDIQRYAEITGDTNPVHLDETYARTTRFGRRVVHGMLTAGFISTVLGTKLPGPGTIYLGQSLRFLAPVYPGDTITATARIERYDEQRGRMTLSTVCSNGAGEQVLTGDAEVLYRP